MISKVVAFKVLFNNFMMSAIYEFWYHIPYIYQLWISRCLKQYGMQITQLICFKEALPI